MTQSAIAAREHGFKVSVLENACGTADPAKEDVALRYLVEVVGVRVCDVAEVTFGQSRIEA